jgi:cytochrome c-type biogenesis protein CcmE
MKKTHIIGLAVIAIAIAAIIGTFTDSSSYVGFEKALANKGTTYHVIGELNKDKELYYNPIEDANHFSFYLVDEKGVESKVVFTGTKPQDFERSEQIVLTGSMRDEYFHADKILMKCPSKYQEDQIAIGKEVTAENI